MTFTRVLWQVWLIGVAYKSTICSCRGPYQALRSKEKRVFRDYRYERSETQLPLVPKTPDLAVFLWLQQKNRSLYPCCACMRMHMHAHAG